MIGNADYRGHGGLQSLETTVNDAKAMANRLTRLKFDDIEPAAQGVRAKTDLDACQMRETLMAFGSKIDQETYADALFYFAGHGYQTDNENYLVPIAAGSSKAGEDDAIRLFEVASQISRASHARIIFIDACRHDGGMAKVGLPAKVDPNYGLPPRSNLKPVTPPSAVVERAREVFIGYAAAPGQQANEGTDVDGLSPFTEALVRNLGRKRRANLLADFKRVRTDVDNAPTPNRQEPSYYDGLGTTAEFIFKD